VEWIGADSWRAQVPLAVGVNAITLEAYDFQGNLVGSDTIEVTNTGTVEPASAANLAITEIHYHPAGPTQREIDAGFDDQDLFEFIELRNIGENTIDLSGASFSDGIEFGFQSAAITQLAPGNYAIVVSNRDAFELRYTTGLPIAGQYARNLSNQGEALRLDDANGNAIAALSYTGSAPWPAEADGFGPSLEIIDAEGDESSPANWAASGCIGGTPAEYHAIILAAWRADHFDAGERLDADISGDFADPDNDRIPNLIEHAFAMNPRLPDASLGISANRVNGAIEVTHRMPRSAIGAKIGYEVSDDLVSWSSANAIEIARSGNGNGIDTVTFSIESLSEQSFIRATAIAP
jgi:hypothetical protein